MLVNIHHDGLWHRPDGASGDFHTLWDLALKVDMGGVTYHAGYQRGSAAPLFVPTEITRAGLSFVVGRGTARSGGADADEEDREGVLLDHPLVEAGLRLIVAGTAAG